MHSILGVVHRPCPPNIYVINFCSLYFLYFYIDFCFMVIDKIRKRKKLRVKKMTMIKINKNKFQ